MKPFLRAGALRLLSIVGRNARGKIVFYHDVHRRTPMTGMSTPFELFADQVARAKRRGFSFVEHVPTEDRTVQVCFDDGFAGVWDCRDELLGMGIAPTVYVAVELIGKPNYLDKGQILELQELGFSFQSHTWTHRGLTEVPEGEWVHELGDSRKWLADFLQRDVKQLCFPKGRFSRKIYEQALAAGYDQLLSSIPGSVDQGIAPHILPRNLVQFYSPAEYVDVLNGALSPLRERYVRMHVKKWELCRQGV